MSLNDRIVKDADKLRRYTKSGLEIDAERFGETLEEGLGRLRSNIGKCFFTHTARKLAEKEISKREAESSNSECGMWIEKKSSHFLFCHSGLDPWFDRPFDRLMVLSNVEGLTTLSKVEGESSSFFRSVCYWMPVDDPVFSGDQVRHDDQKLAKNIVA